MALRLFERDGFDDVTMDDVARAAKVSRRTLFRLFPSKADLVWEGLDDVLRGVEARAADLPRRASLGAAVDALFGEGLRLLEDPKLAKVAKRRLRLMATSPALLTHEMLDRIQEVVSSALERTRRAGDAPPALVARSIFAVAFSSLLWWAQGDQAMAPREVLHAAMAAVGEATAR